MFRSLAGVVRLEMIDGLLTGLIAGALSFLSAAWVAARNERAVSRKMDKEFESRRLDVHIATLRAALTDYTELIARSVHEMAWLTWHASRVDSSQLIGMIDQYEARFYEFYPHITVAICKLFALNPMAGHEATGLYEELTELEYRLADAVWACRRSGGTEAAALADFNHEVDGFERRMPKNFEDLIVRHIANTRLLVHEDATTPT